MAMTFDALTLDMLIWATPVGVVAIVLTGYYFLMWLERDDNF